MCNIPIFLCRLVVAAVIEILAWNIIELVLGAIGVDSVVSSYV